MKYVIFSDPVSGWTGTPIRLIESNEQVLLALKESGLEPRLVEDDSPSPMTRFRRSGGKRGGYYPVKES